MKIKKKVSLLRRSFVKLLKMRPSNQKNILSNKFNLIRQNLLGYKFLKIFHAYLYLSSFSEKFSQYHLCLVEFQDLEISHRFQFHKSSLSLIFLHLLTIFGSYLIKEKVFDITLFFLLPSGKLQLLAFPEILLNQNQGSG